MSRLPKYAKKVIEKSIQSGLQHQKGLFIIGIAHDVWCDLLNDRGPCNCNPEVGEPKKFELKKP